MAFSVTAVSIRVSPLVTEEARDRHGDDVGAQPLGRDLERGLVRVEFSKNRFMTVRPRSRSSVLVDWRFRSTKASARSSRLSANGGFRSAGGQEMRFRERDQPVGDQVGCRQSDAGSSKPGYTDPGPRPQVR